MEKSSHRSAEILQQLIRCPSVTPEEGGALDYLEELLGRIGFIVERVTFSQQGTPDVENLYARLGDQSPHLMFAGHTDVVPPGDENAWTVPPFDGQIKDGHVYGRGAVDMKGGIACFIAAVENVIDQDGRLPGSISLLITGDEEGPSVNGSDKLLKWAADKGEVWDAAIVGEPSNVAVIGDQIKNGRRGSLSGQVTINGKQGHAAYPHLADNPVNGAFDLIEALVGEAFDEGSDAFQPTNMEITSVDTDNDAVNVIAEKTSFRFNIRFNDLWDEKSLKAEINKRLDAGAGAGKLRCGKDSPVNYKLDWIGRVSPVFLTKNEKLTGTLAKAIEKISGKKAALSTGGGTSDARFIKDFCPVVEFGMVGQTMHQIDEHTSLVDLEQLTAIYAQFIKGWFGISG